MEKRTYGEVSSELLEVTCKINKLQDRQKFVDRILSQMKRKRNLLSAEHTEKLAKLERTIQSYVEEKQDNDVLIDKLILQESALLTEVDSIVHELCPAN